MVIKGRFPHTARKAARANKMIAFGADGSSTADYARQAGRLANVGSYTGEDVVMVSINGYRPNRIGISAYEEELLLAVTAGAAFIAASRQSREKSYNVGERELAVWLAARGYHEDPEGSGLWRP